jgi:hypothetical protein
MKIMWSAALMLLMLAAGAVHAEGEENEAEEQQGIQWLTDAAKAKSQAEEQGKKLFVVWGTEW